MLQDTKPDPRLAFVEFFNEAFDDILTARIPDTKLMLSKETARYIKGKCASRKRKGGGK